MATPMAHSLALQGAVAKSSPSLMVRDCVAAAVAGIKDSGKSKGASVMHLATGPVSTAACAAHTIGWSHLRGRTWATCSGHELDLASADPFAVKKLAEQDVATWL